jgi:hypothetical protein
MVRSGEENQRGYGIGKGIAMCERLNSKTGVLQPPGKGSGLFLALLLLFASSLSVAGDEVESALYWRISKDGQQAGYLLGTIHSEDPRVLDFTETFIEQLNSCSVFAMEMVPNLPTLKRLTEYMHYEDAETLKAKLGPERFDRVMNALSGYQVPTDWKERMKIWAVMMTLSVPPPETGFFMDLSLSLRAAGSGLKVVGLETLEQQLLFLEDMPDDYQLTLLDHALDDLGSLEEVHADLIEAYLTGDLDNVSALSDEQFASLDADIRDYFISLGIDARNHRMLENILLQLKESQVFIAVGALHLPGQQGLIALLRQQGYTLEPLPVPFLTEE